MLRDPGFREKILRREVPADAFARHLPETGHSPSGLFELPEGARMFRARILTDGEHPSQVRDASYPPLERTLLQRANKIGEQVFYASGAMETTLVECRVRTGDRLFVGEWRCLQSLALRKIGYVDAAHTDEFEQLCHELFSLPDGGFYPYTSSIAQRWMGHEQVHGIAYPSVACGGDGLNLALKTSTADQSIAFVCAKMFLVERDHTGGMALRELGHATSPGGIALQWA